MTVDLTSIFTTLIFNSLDFPGRIFKHMRSVFAETPPLFYCLLLQIIDVSRNSVTRLASLFQIEEVVRRTREAFTGVHANVSRTRNPHRRSSQRLPS
jgi:hypothetical protein